MAPHRNGTRQGSGCTEDLFDLPWLFSSPSGLRFLPKAYGCLLQMQGGRCKQTYYGFVNCVEMGNANKAISTFSGLSCRPRSPRCWTPGGPL